MTKCPICGGVVAYQGLSNLECHGDPFCPNWVEPHARSSRPSRSSKSPKVDWRNLPWPVYYPLGGHRV